MQERDRLADDLARAVGDGQLHAVFQPQIDLGSGEIVAAEGLCRWQHPVRGPIAPDTFIPLAESTGVIHEIGQFMIDECIAAADRWRLAGSRIEIAVNVSPLQLTASFARALQERWSARGSAADALTLEITESLPMADLATSVSHLTALRDLGIGISLDDYGTGYASQAQIERLPVTEVKLDRSLIQQGARNAADEVGDIVVYAHERRLRVVAEGIEDAAQLAFAREVGCDRAQGYLLGWPTSSARIEQLLTA